MSMRELVVKQINHIGRDFDRREDVAWDHPKRGRYSSCQFNEKHISQLNPDFSEVPDEDLVQLLVSVTRCVFRQR